MSFADDNDEEIHKYFTDTSPTEWGIKDFLRKHAANHVADLDAWSKLLHAWTKSLMFISAGSEDEVRMKCANKLYRAYCRVNLKNLSFPFELLSL
jgi:UDP-N-acetyl-D-mannosaminuronic acid transferase (WecB/TagA/CpsF family)